MLARVQRFLAGDITTADVADEFDDVRSCDLQFRRFGGAERFAGPVRTVRCHDDNVLVKDALSTPGEGCVLVVDGGGSLHTALIGDLIAGVAVQNGWAGLVFNGAARDSAELAKLPLCVKAIGTNPRRSRKLGGGEVDVTIGFGGVTFAPGEWVFGDDDGLIVMDADRASAWASGSR